MSIHKMGFTTSAVERREEIAPPHGWWYPKKDVTHLPYRQMGGSRWGIFTQNAITIPAKSSITLELGLGVRTTKGLCLVTLRRNIMDAECSLRDITVAEDTRDITITIQNHSYLDVSLLEGDPLCYVKFVEKEYRYREEREEKKRRKAEGSNLVNEKYEKLKTIRTNPRRVEILDRETGEVVVYPSMYKAGKAFGQCARVISKQNEKVGKNRYEIKALDDDAVSKEQVQT